MKKKLHISFLGLGILALFLSQLITLIPAPRASAATLDLTTLQNETYKFSAYSAFHFCTTQIGMGPFYKNDGEIFSGVDGPNDKAIGFAGADEGNNDGRVFCDQASHLWSTVAGYATYADMLKDLGFSQSTENAGQVDENNPTNTSIVWSAKAGTNIAANHEKAAKAKSIPTSVPKWGRYMLAVSAMKAKCSLGAGGATNTVPVVNATGTVTQTSYYNLAQANLAAFPDPSSRGRFDTSCQYLASVLNDKDEGGAAVATAMANSRIDSTISTAKTAVCDSLNLESQKAKDNCQVDFGNYLKTCIDSYYAGNAHASAISRSEPFDATVVSTCVENLAKKDGYDITAETIAGFLTSAQDANTPAESDTSTTTDDPCSVLAPGEMRWLACALLTAGSGIAETFYAIIQSLLYTPVAQTFKSIDTPFKTFRLLGMGLIVITGLIMIIAQATGSDLVDAYTVKKVLPKLGVALIGIALSLPLLRFAIELTNNIGFLLGDFIANAGGAQNLVIPASGSDGVGATLVALVGLTIAGVGAFVYGLSVISFILILAIGLLVGVVTLALRQTAIVVLVLIAPLAIASYVLPGTDKLWKFWKNTFLTTLLMFPIIMLFIKSGVLMAGIFGSNGDGGFSQLMAVLVYFAPYFMLPMAFKMAGGLMGNVFGMLNDRMKGAYNGLRSWRSNTRKRRVADMVAGKELGPNIFGNRARKFMNNAITRAATTYEGSLALPGTRKAGEYKEWLVNSRDQHAAKSVSESGAIAGHTPLMKVLRDGVKSEDDAVEKLATDEEFLKSHDGDITKSRAAARQAVNQFRGITGLRANSSSARVFAVRALVADNTANDNRNEDGTIDLDKIKKNQEEHFGSIQKLVDEGLITEGTAIGLVRENKQRGDLSSFSSGTAKTMLSNIGKNNAEGKGYTFTPEEMQVIEREMATSISSSSAAYGNPRVAEILATLLNSQSRNALAGKDIADDADTAKKREQFIDSATSTMAAAFQGSEGRSATDAEMVDIRREAEKQYKIRNVYARGAQLLGVQETLPGALPVIAAHYSDKLLDQRVSVKDIDKDLYETYGITDQEVESGKTLSLIELNNRIRDQVITFRREMAGDQQQGRDVPRHDLTPAEQAYADMEHQMHQQQQSQNSQIVPPGAGGGLRPPGS